MSSPTPKIVAYDGDCPFCVGTTDLLVRAGLLEEQGRRPFQDFEGEDADRLWAAGIRNEIVVLGPEELRQGSDGILWLLRDGWARPLADVLSLPVLRSLTREAYRLVSYNRRAISLPRPRGIACACDPVDRPSYQLAFALLATGVALISWAGLAAWVAPGPSGRWFLGSFLAGGIGWLLVAVLAYRALPERRLRFLPQLAMALLRGALTTGIVGLIARVVFGAWGPVPWLLAFGGGAWVLARSLGRRARYLKLEGRWAWGWAPVWLPVAAVSLWLAT